LLSVVSIRWPRVIAPGGQIRALVKGSFSSPRATHAQPATDLEARLKMLSGIQAMGAHRVSNGAWADMHALGLHTAWAHSITTPTTWNP